eukprot:CAMPEP_0170490202 /NCGR_PEP_ID=MMETSP0208-20121228/8445_1 /TAXON_ID=197538 /ORGANISM="Strombidium inclinatum, Strain S3" /LENGTH=188 /DNA_ID=CAMNT_0010765485 /DNA_START=718 /DNA_END=1284 /DNA_ORIENTATION=+
MAEDLPYFETLADIFLKNGFNKVVTLVRGLGSALVVLVRNFSEHCFVGLSLERQMAHYHRVEHYSGRPDVDGSRVPFLFDGPQRYHLGSHVGRSAAAVFDFVVVLDLGLLADAEISDLDDAFVVDEDVFELDVPVHHILGVDVPQASDDLPEDELRSILLQSASPSNILQQVASLGHFHEDQVVVGRL